LTVEKGDYLAIMSKFGYAKSTVLNILVILDKSTRCQLFLNGINTTTIKNNR